MESIEGGMEIVGGEEIKITLDESNAPEWELHLGERAFWYITGIVAAVFIIVLAGLIGAGIVVPSGEATAWRWVVFSAVLGVGVLTLAACVVLLSRDMWRFKLMREEERVNLALGDEFVSHSYERLSL